MPDRQKQLLDELIKRIKDVNSTENTTVTGRSFTEVDSEKTIKPIRKPELTSSEEEQK